MQKQVINCFYNYIKYVFYEFIIYKCLGFFFAGRDEENMMKKNVGWEENL